MKRRETFRVTMTARISREMDDSILYLVNNKSYSDYSNAIRSLIDKGLQVHELQEIYKNPEKTKEFESKMSEMLHADNVQELAETMSLEQLKAAKFVFANVEEKKLKQLLIDIQ